MNKEKMPQRGKNKRLLVIAIVIVSVLIVAVIGYLFYLIYHKDEPKFVPGDTRGEIREGIKEKIAVPIANVWPAIGEPMVAAVYKSPTTETESPDSTADWQTYKNEELGVEIKYPKDWVTKSQNYIGAPLNQLGYITFDPSTEKLENAQISLRVIEDELYKVEDGELSDVTITKRTPKIVSNIKGNLYEIAAQQFSDGSKQFSFLWIGQKGNLVYVITYTPNDAEMELLNNYEEMLNNSKLG